MLKKYLQEIFNISKTGDAREESFYSALEKLFEEFIIQKGKKYSVTTLPKKTEAGNPDFRIWDGTQKIVGYIEAKSPTVENLGTIENTTQLKRYRQTFPNLILTNFFEFRLYRNGELINQTAIGRPFIIAKLQSIPPVENEAKFFQLLEQFFAFSIPKITTAKELATELAKRTKYLKDQLIEELRRENKIEGVQTLEAFYKAFKDHLITTITPQEFANLFSQTITYGLFVARLRANDGFNRELAFKFIPPTIGILKNVFRFISSTDLPISMKIIDDIAEVLAVTNVRKIIEHFYQNGKGKDPIIHFYETFLAEYDPTERERRGVYYTPESVVKYIVRSTNQLLKEKFGKQDGFADQSVTVLDPAAGTLTFPVEAIRLAVDEYKGKYGSGGIKTLIKQHILKNFYAFELMMAPYAIGHLKISLVLDEYGYKLSEKERFNLFLTNTLELSKIQDQLPGVFERSLAKESEGALSVKEKKPIMVIFGNPPYSVSSANKTEFIEREMEIYKEDVSQERNIQPLSDDYVKFIRFAHWKIEKTGYGIIGMITNNSYLSGLIHRGMRKKLLETFNEIYILNLHGNIRIREKTPEGNIDENVFDIMQGVAIAIFVKYKKNNKLGKVYYQDLYGLREEKYDYLEKNNVKSTSWEKLELTKPYYFFIKKDFSLKNKYDKFISVVKIFKKHIRGVVTSRDHFVIDFDKDNLKQRIETFVKFDLDDDLIKTIFNLKDGKNWQVKKARKELRKKGIDESNFVNYLYRPFDERIIFYDEILLERARKKIMESLKGQNMAMLLMRQVYWSGEYTHVFVANSIVDSRVFISNRGAADIFPLYLYSEEDLKKQNNKGSKGSLLMLFDKPKEGYLAKTPNINQKLFKDLKILYKTDPSPEEIFYYIYAILYSNIYRQKYEEFLKIDFPKVPFTDNYNLFQKLARYGRQLVEWHLLNSPDLIEPIIKFYGTDSNKVEKRDYRQGEKRLYINSAQYFEKIESAVWHYQIGGYQVLDKWLKDRKGRNLSSEEIKLYCRIASSISKTIEIQKKIDQFYLEIERNLI